jgi:NodT family efflux transporter outer membrane factor (OMF) lipoprotein
MSAENKLPARLCLRLAGVVILSLLQACAAGPDFERPAPPAVSRYTHEENTGATVDAAGGVQHFQAGEQIAADWWRLYGSKELDDAVRQAILHNPSLQSAQASLRQSQDNLRAGQGVFFPQLDASFSATRQRSSPFRLGAAAPGSIFNLFTLGAVVSYALDVFGGERRAVEGLGAQVDYQRYTMLATYLALSGNIVNTMIARAAYAAQWDATGQLVKRQQEQLEIAEKQAENGIAPYASVLAIKSQLAANRAALPALAQKRDQAEHLLASLQGAFAADQSASTIALGQLALPASLPLSLPSQLVRQRPDVLAAEAQLHAASANIGIATAALFPSFSLSASYGLSNNTIGGLSDSPSKFWSAGPAVDVPLFHGAADWYRRRAALDAYQKSLADYRQTVLAAFQQVADVLTAVAHDAQSLQAQAEALQAAEQALALTEANYRAGLVSYLDVLVADAQSYQSKINYLQVLGQRYQDTAALFVALGGGWWNDSQLALEPAPLAQHKEKEQ